MNEPTPTPTDGCPATVRRSPSIAKLAGALCAAQSEIKNPTKNKKNPHFGNTYADFAAVLEAVLPVFTKHKLSVTQLPCELGPDAAMTTILMHESGEWIETVSRIRHVKNDPQSVGSAQSYCKRYALQSLAGVAAEDDDDGHAATHRPPPRRESAHDATLSPAADLFDRLKDDLEAAATGDDLKAAFGRAFRAHEAKRIGDDAYRRLTAIKDDRKVSLAGAAK